MAAAGGGRDLPDGGVRPAGRQAIFWGPLASPEYAHLGDAEGPEWVALVLLSALLVLFGLVPALALGPVDRATVALLDRLGVLP